MDQDRFVAVALLTDHELQLLGPTFEWAWPVEEAPEAFQRLLLRIDEVDREMNASIDAD